MHDAKLIELVDQFQYVPLSVCRVWKYHSEYEDVLAAARSGMIVAIRAYDDDRGKQDRENKLLTHLCKRAKYAALHYMRRYSRLVRGKNWIHDFSRTCVSLNAPVVNTDGFECGDHIDLIEDNTARNPAEAACIADDIRYMYGLIDSVEKERKRIRKQKTKTSKTTHRPTRKEIAMRRKREMELAS